MQNDTFEMSTGQAHEFAMACGRNGLTRADIKLLSTGNNLRRSVDFLNRIVVPEQKSGASFPVYFDVEVGGKSKDELLAELKAGGYRVSYYAKDIMSKPAWKPGKRERVKFARAKIRDLGFTKRPTITKIWARIRELGYSLCEPSDGPAIRLADRNQRHEDYYWVAMEQIVDADGNPYVFYVVRRDGELWFRTDWTLPDDEWDLDDEIVFRLSNSLHFPPVTL